MLSATAPLDSEKTAPTQDYLRNLLYNISLVSSECTGSITVKRRKSEEDLLLRPTLHITQITPFGKVKSELARRLEIYCEARRHPFLYMCNATAAAIAGSVDEDHKVVVPLNYHAINGTVVIDEFKTVRHETNDAVGACLSILENERSQRAMARLPNVNRRSRKGSPVEFEVADGKVIFKGLRSNWIFLTSRDLNKARSTWVDMLVSRTVPVYYDPTLEELKAIDDDPSLLFQPLDLNVPQLNPIDNATYLRIRDHVERQFAEQNIPDNYYLRTIGDCVRAYVFQGYKFDEDLFNYIIGQKKLFAQNVAINEYLAKAQFEDNW